MVVLLMMVVEAMFEEVKRERERGILFLLSLCFKSLVISQKLFEDSESQID